MELLLALAAGAAGVALLVQAKALPSEAEAKKAKEKLDANPVDPDANTTYGKYTAFVVGDYSAAMPYLVHSADKNLQSLATHELDNSYTDTPAKKVGMGDEWVAAAKNFKPIYRSFYDRAAQWYALAWPDLDTIWKDKVRERFKKILAVSTPTGLKQGLPGGWTSSLAAPKTAVDGTIAHNGGKSVKVEAARPKLTESFWVQSAPMVAPKGPVTFSAWVASDGTDSAQDRIIVDWYNQAGVFIGRSEPFIPVDSPFWQKVEVKTTVPKDASRFRVAFTMTSTKGTVWVDDFSIVDANGREYVDNGSFEK